MTQPLQNFPVLAALGASAKLIPRDGNDRGVARRRSALGWAFARQAPIAAVIARKGFESSVDARAAMMMAQRLLRTPTPHAASALRPTGLVPEVKLVPPTKTAEDRITSALRLRYLSRYTWTTRRSPSQGPRRSRLSEGWSMRRVSCTIFLASNAEPRSACGSVLSVVCCLVFRSADAHEGARAPEVRACDAWTVDWATDSPVVSPAKPVRVVEYDHDGEFRHLGYTYPLTAHSRTAEKALTTLTRRAAKVFATKT